MTQIQGTTGGRHGLNNNVQIAQPRRYGDRVYMYSGHIETIAVAGVDTPFMNIDKAVIYKLYVGLWENTPDDLDVTININGVNVFRTISTDARGFRSGEIVEFICPPSANVNINVNNISGATARTVFVVLTGQCIHENTGGY